MKLSTIYLLFALFFFTGCNNNTNQSQKEIRAYDAKLKETKSTIKTHYYLSSEIIDLDVDGYVDQVYIYTYDKEFNLIKKEFESLFNKHYTYIAYLYEYDEIFNKTKETIKDQFGNILSQSDFYYDENFNLINISMDTDNDFMVDNLYYFEYDLNNNLIKKENDYGADGLIDYVSDITYDTNSTVLKEVLYKADDINSTISTLYTYDKNNNLIKKEQYSNDTIEYTISYIYDAKKRLVQEFYNSKNIQSYFQYSYDKNNNLIKKEQYSKDGVLQTVSTYGWIKS